MKILKQKTKTGSAKLHKLQNLDLPGYYQGYLYDLSKM